MKKSALLVIDYTWDFVAEEGALTCGKPGQDIEEEIVKHLEEAYKNQQLIIFPIDLHFENDINHPESKLFPPHNIKGTKGRELYGKVGAWFQKQKSSERVIWIDKTRYSAFYKTDLYNLLQKNHIEEVELTGVCTDICVFQTAVEAYNLGYRITVYKDAVASFNPIGHEWALGQFTTTFGGNVK